MRTALFAVVGWLSWYPAALAHEGQGSRHSARVSALFEKVAPGSAVLVVSHGKVVHSQGYGYADLEQECRISPLTNFRLASLTKPFTAMAIIILEERKKLHYDDPMTKFFPDIKFPSWAGQVTLRHLLHHNAGLPEYDGLFEDEGTIGRDWPRSSRSKPDQNEPTSRDVLQVLARQKTLKFVPGEQHEYSNSGYVVLGQVVERVSGKSYSDFLRDEIFKPLRMDGTLASDGKTPPVPRRAFSYRYEDGPARRHGVYEEIDYTPLNRVVGDDGVHSSADDLKKFADELANPTLVSKASLKLAFTPGTLNDGKAIDYGFGWAVTSRFGETCIFHNGSWIGVRTYFARYPAKDLTVIVLANYAECDETKTGEQVARIFLEE